MLRPAETEVTIAGEDVAIGIKSVSGSVATTGGIIKSRGA
jgi:hypothetical protein